MTDRDNDTQYQARSIEDVGFWHRGEVRRVIPERPLNLQEQPSGSKMWLKFRLGTPGEQDLINSLLCTQLLI